jgi:hypothetical protein
MRFQSRLYWICRGFEPRRSRHLYSLTTKAFRKKPIPRRPALDSFLTRCDETVMRIRSVRDARYRYIRNFTPETPLLAPNAYKEEQYPVWNLLKARHVEGKLTPAQEFLCQPRMPDEELYALETDPHQTNNLAASEDPKHQAELEKLRAVLSRWMVEVNDQGR